MKILFDLKIQCKKGNECDCVIMKVRLLVIYLLDIYLKDKDMEKKN